MSRRIVFINQATGYLAIDIINQFVSKFDEVALITGSIRVQDIPLHRKVKLSKITRYNRGNNKLKLYSWIIATIQIFFLLLFKFRGYEIFYFTIPPTTYLLSLVIKRKFSILIYDIFPDALKIFKSNDSGFLFRQWQKWNNKLFSKLTRFLH